MTRQLIEGLIKRGEQLFESAWKQIEQLQLSGDENLIHAYMNEAALVEALTVDLKIQIHDLNQTHSIYHVHAIEEELLYQEHRLAEEMAVINDVRNNHQHQTQPDQNIDAQKLISKAESLITKAEVVIVREPNSRESHSIEAEVFQLENLIKTLKEKPSSSDRRKEEQQLARHEKTLEQLLNRQNNHN